MLRLFKKGWSILDADERRRGLIMLFVVILSALTSALMVGSIMPFLAVLADPARIREVDTLSWLYTVGGFSSDYSFLVALGFASLFTIFTANGLQILRLYLVTRFSTMRIHSLSARLLTAYLSNPYEYFLDKHSGELGTQILSETQKAVELFYRPASEAIAAVLTSISIVALLVWVNPVIAMIALGGAGGLYVGSYILSRKIVKRFGKIRGEANRQRFRIANEALASIKEIKLAGREANYISSYSTPSDQMARSEAAAIFIGTLPQYIMQIVAFGGMILLILFLITPESLNGPGTLNSLLPLLGVFAFGGQRLIPELGKFYTSVAQLLYGAPVMDALHRDLSSSTRIEPLAPSLTKPMGLKRSLELRGVSYSYPDAAHVGLSDVTFQIRAGERIGIVGGSGAGRF
jgi:ATP-binding cassette, subfamily B, bacterial PglK